MYEDILYKPIKTKDEINHLIRENQGLVYYMLTQLGQLDNPDAEEAAWDALWDAVVKFDIFSSYQFSTFACRCIKNRIGDVLRQQQRRRKHESSLSDILEDVIQDATLPDKLDSIIAEEKLKRVLKIFDEYISSKHGLARNILLVWQASNFEASVGVVARVVSTTPANVSKTLLSFRAYLDTYLRD